MNTILIVSEKLNYWRLGRQWTGAELVEIREFSGDRPEPGQGCRFVISPAELREIRDRADHTPLHTRDPEQADLALAQEETAIHGLRSERDRLQSEIERMQVELAEMTALVGQEAEKLESLISDVSARETDMERLNASTSPTASREHRRKKKS